MLLSERHGSVDKGAKLVIERLQNLGLTPDVVACHCVLGKTLNAVSYLGAKQSNSCGGLA